MAGYWGTDAFGGRDMNRSGSWGNAAVPKPLGDKRFSVSCHLLKLLTVAAGEHRRVRIQTWLDDGEELATLIPVYPSADYHEREAWDMMGIRFAGPSEPRPHPASRLLGRPPAPQGLARRRRAGAVLGRRLMATTDRRSSTPGRSSTCRRRRRRCTVPRADNPDLLEINLGPNHPSTHGVLRLVVHLDGEIVVGLRNELGYVHTGIEKNIEQKTYWKAITYVPRMDYLSFFSGEVAFCMAVEKLLELEVPRRGEYLRVIFQELTRLHSHLIFLGTGSVDLGGIALLFYCFRDRDYVLDLFEMVTGQRMHPRYGQVGGVAEDIPRGFDRKARQTIAYLRGRHRRVRGPDRRRTRSGASARSASA